MIPKSGNRFSGKIMLRFKSWGRPLSLQPGDQIVLQRDGARAALDQAIDDAGEQVELLAAERAELGVVHLALNRRKFLQRGAALARHCQGHPPTVAAVDALEDEAALRQPPGQR